MIDYQLEDLSPAARKVLEDVHPHRYCVSWQHTGRCRHINAMVAIEKAAYDRGVTDAPQGDVGMEVAQVTTPATSEAQRAS